MSITKQELKRLTELNRKIENHIIDWAYQRMDVDPFDFLEPDEGEEFLTLMDKLEGVEEPCKQLTNN